jgi:hypothetical protein
MKPGITNPFGVECSRDRANDATVEVMSAKAGRWNGSASTIRAISAGSFVCQAEGTDPVTQLLPVLIAILVLTQLIQRRISEKNFREEFQRRISEKNFREEMRYLLAIVADAGAAAGVRTWQHVT